MATFNALAVSVFVTFPRLYDSLPRPTHLSPYYHHPKNVHIHMDDPDLLAFYFDPLINPSHFPSRDDIKECSTCVDLPEEVEPFLPTNIWRMS